MRDDRIGYRDQWDADVQHGICPICGPPYRNGPGPDCRGCNPPVFEYTFACGTTLVTDDDAYCPEHDGTCVVSNQRLMRPPRPEERD